MTTPTQELITAIHASGHPTVLAITGGGSSAIGQLLAVPGASRTVLEAVVPYASTALADWLGTVSIATGAEQSCSEPTARAMAMAAWMRARTLAPDTDPHRLVGVGATASLTSDRPKRGNHRIHIATQTASTTCTHCMTFHKDQRDRAAEETLAAQLIVIAHAKPCEIHAEDVLEKLVEQLFLEGESLDSSQKHGRPEWTQLLLGERSYVGLSSETPPSAILSGSFNPPHAGHRRMVEIASERLGCPVAYELSITNVDKPPLDFFEIERRMAGIRRATAGEELLLTDAPTFRAKAAIFPGCTFIVGADTLARIADPKYYTGPGSLNAAIEQIDAAGCRFLVFGRETGGAFRVLSDLELPPALRKLCDEVPAEEFREDISSTDLRVE